MTVHRRVMLAMVKLGFRPDEVLAMPESEAEGYLRAYAELVGGKPKERTYVVRRDGKKR